ncbi:hypothetical protein [Rikenella microfusus]
MFRRTDEGRIYAATFVDHETRTVINGSGLGREYAARIWDEWSRSRPESEPAQVPFSTEMPEEPTAMRPPHGHAEEPTLIGQTLLEGLDVFGTLFEAEQPPYEYIDPAFRLIRRKKRKKKRSPKF